MTHKTHHLHGPGMAKRSTSFSKTFRWHSAKPGDPQPISVTITGTFTEWKQVPLHHDRVLPTSGSSHVTTFPATAHHHYMPLVDGQPISYKHCDGLAAPATEQEKQYALLTPRGPQVFMLFSNTK